MKKQVVINGMKKNGEEEKVKRVLTEPRLSAIKAIVAAV